MAQNKTEVGGEEEEEGEEERKEEKVGRSERRRKGSWGGEEEEEEADCSTSHSGSTYPNEFLEPNLPSAEQPPPAAGPQLPLLEEVSELVGARSQLVFLQRERGENQAEWAGGVREPWGNIESPLGSPAAAAPSMPLGTGSVASG